MDKDQLKALVDLATITAEILRRLSSAYGAEWREHFHVVMGARDTLNYALNVSKRVG